jgi:penicillin-binding protein 2
MRDMGTHGTIDFIRALQHSCNVYFWTIGERVGIDRLGQTARDFGFGAPTGLGIDEEISGQLPDSRSHGSNAAADLVQTLDAAIGGGDVRVTVIQLAMAYAALANGGRLYAPQIVGRVQGVDGAVEEREPVLLRRVTVWPATLDIVRQGMWRAVNADGGTAFAARRGAVEMAGKTGTAPADRGSTSKRTPHDRSPPTHAWFAGWAPWDRPEIAVVVFIENGGVGGKVAAPVARAIVEGYFGERSPRRR